MQIKTTLEPISRKKVMLIHILGGYVNTGIQIFQGLLLIPLYLHFIGINLYGLWLASGGIIAMLGLLNLGFSNVLIQKISKAYGEFDLSKVGGYFINGLVVYIILTSIFIGIGLVLSLNLSGFFKTNEPDGLLLKQCFQLAVLAAGIGLINECLRGFSFALLKAFYPTLVLATSRIIGMTTTLILLYKDWGLLAIPMGLLATEGLVFLFGVIQTISLLRSIQAQCIFNIMQIRGYFRTGGLLFTSRLGNSLSRDIDPLLITLFLNAEITAAYMIIRKGADIVFQILAVIYGSALAPFSHLAGSTNNEKTGRTAIILIALVFFIGLIGFSCYAALNLSFVSLWVGDTFNFDIELVILIGLAYFAQSLRNMVWQILNGLGEFNVSSRIILFEGLIKTVLAIGFLNWMGISGIPLSLMASSFIALFMLVIELKSHLILQNTIRSYMRLIITIVVLFSFSVAFSAFINVEFWWQFILLSMLCVILITSTSILLNWSLFKRLLKDVLV